MRLARLRRLLAVPCLALVAGFVSTAPRPLLSQQAVNPASAMHWRPIGPTRAGRARPLAGVPSRPNVFYVGFDNGGVWRSTDYGNNWEPVFDKEGTGSIGAIAVAPSDPNVIYVGTGAAIIRPDLATGNGVYKSTDAGKTWRHVGLSDSQANSEIRIHPANPQIVFVASFGRYGAPSEERAWSPRGQRSRRSWEGFPVRRWRAAS